VINKKAETKFTIRLCKNNLSHERVANLLNSQGYHGKAQFIVKAILHYENCDKTPEAKNSLQINEKIIEAVVKRMLKDKNIIFADEQSSSIKIKTEKNPIIQSETVDEINYDDALEVLGEDGLNAITNALDMFWSN